MSWTIPARLPRTRLRRRLALLSAGVVAVAGLTALPAASANAAAGSTGAGAGLIYITTNGPGDTEMFDTVTDTVVGTVISGTQGTNQLSGGVAESPDGRTTYVANATIGTVSVIDNATDTVTATLPAGSGPWAMAVSADGATLYVGDTASSSIAVIDLATGAITATIPAGSTPSQSIALSPDGTSLYVANGWPDTATVIDTRTDTVTAIITLGAPELRLVPWGVAFAPGGATAYVVAGNGDFGSLSVIDTATRTLTATVPMGSAAEAVAVSPTGAFAYVANELDNTLSILDTRTDTVTSTIPVGNGPQSIVFSPNGATAYVANTFDGADGRSGSLSIIDTATQTLTRTVPLPAMPLQLALAPGAPTSTALSIAPADNVLAGSPVMLTAAVTPALAGTVQFYDDAAPLGGPVPVNSGTAVYTSSALTPGDHALAAVFSPADAGNEVSRAAPATLHITPTGFAIDLQMTANGAGAVTTAPFSTLGPRLLVAYVSSDGPAGRQSATVSGAGLTWTLVARANRKDTGTAEIWQARATGALTGATVTSTPSARGYDQSLTVLAYTGAAGIGASAATGKNTGAPAVTLTTTAPGSRVFGVGEDFSHAAVPAPATGQTMIAQQIDPTPGESFWVQNYTAAIAAAGTPVTVNDTAPTTDVWNLAAAEILPAR